MGVRVVACQEREIEKVAVIGGTEDNINRASTDPCNRHGLPLN